MLRRLEHAFAREPVERPEQQQVEPPPVGVAEHLLEAGPPGGAARLMVNILGDRELLKQLAARCRSEQEVPAHG
jgi:hypothetical protein